MGPLNLLSSRPITIDSTLAPGMLIFRSLRGVERLGQLFSYRLEATCEIGGVNPVELIGKPLSVHFEQTTGVRHFNAFITDFEQGAEVGRNTRYELTLRPWLWLLTQVHSARIFQDKSIPEIVKAVFTERGFSDFEEHLFGTYLRREMVVQYGESDFNFVSRLLEEEGIYYFFRHEDAKHVLILADSHSSHAAEPDCQTLPYHVHDSHRARLQETVSAWSPTQRLRPDTFTTRNYDFKHPTADLDAKRRGAIYPAVSGFEVFEYPSPHLIKDRGEEYARLRLEELQADVRTITAETDAAGLLTGRTFKLTDHPEDAENAEYLVVATHCVLRAPESESMATDEGPTYECEFEVMPHGTPFRPPRTAGKPFMRGPQTARVTTAGSEDIWTDEHGRIRVKFDWDRFGTVDDTSSAWVRVAQVWAGSGWGGQFIPRVGMEVLVSFLDGDPDRPLVTGCVYNGDNQPPYPLTANQTQSGIKTRSTKEGTPDNFNEIRFEDKKGEEELHVQAEKDFSTLVKNDKSTEIKHDRTTTISRNDTLKITGDQLIHIHGNLSMTVDGVTDSENKDKSNPIKSSMSVTGAHDMKASDSIALAAPNKITLTVGGSSITITPGAITIKAGGSQIVLDANVLAQSKDGSKVVLDANALAHSSTGSDLVLDANVLAKSSGGSSLVLDGNATVKGADKATLTGATVVVKGGKVSNN
ncbi:MAG TPA: type VI secretion system tip protein TssI/VgrG [Polyangiaceae bacterium]|nr:type VI secretion system tip protein TssI/VgrG [Polyangiaceae bacterium]